MAFKETTNHMRGSEHCQLQTPISNPGNFGGLWEVCYLRPISRTGWRPSTGAPRKLSRWGDLTRFGSSSGGDRPYTVTSRARLRGDFSHENVPSCCHWFLAGCIDAVGGGFSHFL